MLQLTVAVRLHVSAELSEWTVLNQKWLLLQTSGTTATVAAIVGWDLLVASVGDSEAYLDTGAEVIQVNRQPAVLSSPLMH